MLETPDAQSQSEHSLPSSAHSGGEGGHLYRYRLKLKKGSTGHTQKMKLKKKTKNLTSFIPPSTPMVDSDQLPAKEQQT